MTSQPGVPTPSHIEADSMLSQRFGREIVNYFSSSPLNRLSFLRSEHPFLSAALGHSSTRFLLFNQLAPLTRSPSELFYATFKDVERLVRRDMFDQSEADCIKNYNSSITTPQVVFLGLDETQKESGMTFKSYVGAPYFALDVTPKGTMEKEAKGVIAEMEGKGLSFDTGRTVMSLSAEEAPIYAQARALLDWNARNTFCGTCGHRTLSVNAGTKRTCPPTDLAAPSNSENTTATTRPPCTTRTTLSNLSFPRTDPTIIVAVLSHDSHRILLGRQKRWPQHMYSTLAGFIEPAESVEDAVRREVWEESGVILSRVIIHSTQPWPYPANLMIGAIAQVARKEDEDISLKHDPELEDARWFEVAEVRDALRIGTSVLGEPAGPLYKEGGLRLPPSTAIANQLIAAVVKDEFLVGLKNGAKM
ncbi:NADH pyrophosphatase [Arachnomyces sp. PD_36]|nr:NADH pyrophosphatase [Arachnomyces sp. PD_36]